MTSDSDPAETSEWRESFDSVLEFDGVERGELPARGADQRGPSQRCSGAVLGEHAVPEHDPAGRGAGAPRRPEDRAQDPVADPLERRGDRVARQQGVLRAGWPHRVVPVRGHALRAAACAAQHKPPGGSRNAAHCSGGPPGQACNSAARHGPNHRALRAERLGPGSCFQRGIMGSAAGGRHTELGTAHQLRTEHLPGSPRSGVSVFLVVGRDQLR
jgi:hypothetical protein